MSEEKDLIEWLQSTEELRAKLLAYGRSPIPTEAGDRQIDVSTALEHGQDAGDLLADAETFVLQAEAAAVLAVRRTHPELTASERKVLASLEASEVTRLRDGIAVLYRTIKDRRFALMNLNRSA